MSTSKETIESDYKAARLASAGCGLFGLAFASAGVGFAFGWAIGWIVFGSGLVIDMWIGDFAYSLRHFVSRDASAPASPTKTGE